VPALTASIVPYFYFLYLVVLLFDRQLRDEKKCAEKYGEAWKEYCRLVPWKIIPFLY
jgi:7-dehydrocholesterol reductase